MDNKTKGQAPSRLAERIDVFAHYYWKTFNAASSAEKAGYSKRTARNMGYKLLQREDVQKRLREIAEEQRNRREIDRNWVIDRLVNIVEFDPVEMIDINSDGTFSFKDEWPEGALKHVSIGCSITSSNFKDGGETQTSSFNLKPRTDRRKSLLDIWNLCELGNDGSGSGNSPGSSDDVKRRVLESLRKRKR